MASAVSENAPRSRFAITPAWVVALGMALLAVPTIATLGEQVWSKESGAHGPIVLVTGLWLLWRKRDEMLAAAAPGSDWLTIPAMAASLALYIFGRAYDFISLEVVGLYGVGVSLLYACFGLRVLLTNWFPLLYLGFLVPPPGWFMDGVTAPLKLFVSFAATEGLQAVGIPVFREGVTLMIGHYQLLVEDACSGMNSITGLVAISLFYIYLLRNASWRYSLFLVALVIPIAIVANIIRIVTLVLLTYFFGDAVAQGFLHMAAGIFLFVTALLLVFAVDHLMSRLLKLKGAAA
ncbi:exosortase [Phenylobacterium haematophilum]|uniref:Exosortase n=1 Tax=Phenylobacterium haematophilum TaxID=98513 RepID=A0A840A106_9CAUL|nr:exosortase [Phenylobacterium haematophilum]